MNARLFRQILGHSSRFVLFAFFIDFKQKSIDQYKIKVLVFSIQYAFKILKYQYQYSIWKILKQYQYQYLKNTEVSVFSISIFSEKNDVKTQYQIRTTVWSKVNLSLQKSPPNNLCHNYKWPIKAAKWNGVRYIHQNIFFPIFFNYLILILYLGHSLIIIFAI